MGADVTVIPMSLYRVTKDGELRLRPSSKQLSGPSQKSLDVCGQFIASVTMNDRSVQETVYVIRGLQMPLLGRPVIDALKLVTQLDLVNSLEKTIVHSYQSLFKGLGVIEGGVYNQTSIRSPTIRTSHSTTNTNPIVH